MGRNLSLLARLPRIEDDGVIHRRDCECVRCDAGFRPSEQERAEARRRVEARRARERMARAQTRADERVRMKQAETSEHLDAEVQAADEQVRALREARERVGRDRRLAELWALRRAGLSLRDALDEVERRVPDIPPEPPAEKVGPAGFEPATYGLKVRSSTS
jgi:hypothetical protein